MKNKSVYRLKIEENSSQSMYKEKLIVKGFSRKQGVDFEEKFSFVVKISSIIVLSLAANLNLKIEQLDVKVVFFYGDIE